MKLLCNLGLHKWRPWNPPGIKALLAGGARAEVSRVCARCKLGHIRLTRPL